jgi:RNase P/RNase MRP subunit p30
MIDTNNIEKAKIEIKKSTDRPLIIVAQDDEFNRKMLEYGKFDILLGIEKGNRKSSLRQLDSGFNHFLARVAAKNKISLGIDLSEIKKLDKKEKAERIGKIRQNIKISRKAGVNIKIINYSDKKDAFNLLLNLGASTKQAREAISF